MIILFIFLVFVLILFCLGFAILDYSCGRKHHETDYWDEKQLVEHGYGELKESVFSGRDWFLSQNREELVCMSYDGLKLHGIMVQNENAKGTILLFHGWHSSYKLDFMSSIEYYYSLGYNIIICEQRAHGESEGHFLSYGVKESRDVDSWVTFAVQLFGEEHPIYLGGISMGATTVLMAADMPMCGNVRGIIADCGFSSPYDIIGCVMMDEYRFAPLKPTLALLNIFTRAFAGFGLKEKSVYDTVRNSLYPILFFHGKSDGFVPYQMTVKAYELCTSEKTLVLIPGARHGLSYIVAPERYKEEIRKFTEDNLN